MRTKTLPASHSGSIPEMMDLCPASLLPGYPKCAVKPYWSWPQEYIKRRGCWRVERGYEKRSFTVQNPLLESLVIKPYTSSQRCT